MEKELYGKRIVWKKDCINRNIMKKEERDVFEIIQKELPWFILFDNVYNLYIYLNNTKDYLYFYKLNSVRTLCNYNSIVSLFNLKTSQNCLFINSIVQN